MLLQCSNRFGQRRLDAGPFAPYIGVGVVADLIAVFVPEAENCGVANFGGGVGCGGGHDLVVGEDRVAGLTSDLHRLVGEVDFGHALATDFVPVLFEMILEDGLRAGPGGEVVAVVVEIDGNQVTIDAPLVQAIETQFGGGSIYKYKDLGRIERVGVENLRGISEFDESILDERREGEYADEDHGWNLITIN